MNPVEREQVRLSLLRYLAANRTPYGLPVGALRQYLAAEGTVIEAEFVASEMAYLTDKGLVEEIQKRLSPEVRCWRITANGRDLMAQMQGI